jgi:hypothetical protein
MDQHWLRVKILGGMQEFVGETGVILWREGPFYRVRLDNPVEVEGVGIVGDDLWEGPMLRRLHP